MISCKFEFGKETSLRHVTMNALIAKDDRILLIRRSKQLIEGEKLALPGGFLDRDETVMQGIQREVLEETGWQITNLQLFHINSNPRRPNDEGRQNVDFNFIADPVIQSGKADWESTEMIWMSFSEVLESGQIAFDHADVIKRYSEYRDAKFSLPIII